MALYKVDVQTNYYGDYITNVYHVDASSITVAMDQAEIIAELQRKLLFPDQFIDYLRVSTPAEGDGLYFAQPVNYPGTRPTAGQLLPSFCRYRVDMSVGFRRPLRKFLLSLTEADQASGQMEAATISFCNTNYATPLVGLGFVCGPTGLPILSAACNATVGMRQLRRASKRKTPVIS